MPVSGFNNRLSVSGAFTGDDCLHLVGAMHNIIHVKGYKDVELDFSQCTKAFSSQMLVVCGRGQQYWKSGVDINLTLPLDEKMQRLFLNTNWAHLIDFRSFNESRYRGYTHAPAIRFSDAKSNIRLPAR